MGKSNSTSNTAATAIQRILTVFTTHDVMVTDVLVGLSGFVDLEVACKERKRTNAHVKIHSKKEERWGKKKRLQKERWLIYLPECCVTSASHSPLLLVRSVSRPETS